MELSNVVPAIFTNSISWKNGNYVPLVFVILPAKTVAANLPIMYWSATLLKRLFSRHYDVCGHLFQTVIVLEQITDLKVFMRISMHSSMPDILIYSFS
jgi:hypothetical protein